MILISMAEVSEGALITEGESCYFIMRFSDCIVFLGFFGIILLYSIGLRVPSSVFWSCIYMAMGLGIGGFSLRTGPRHDFADTILFIGLLYSCVILDCRGPCYRHNSRTTAATVLDY
jgi:hypothetical protein